mmetsp:Transcript_22707/g.64661  ORF Transcript_22707/g.64661 Transcript_22707/m.64661 type:complete len:530 (+) Transcript_22707:210-1799(+)
MVAQGQLPLLQRWIGEGRLRPSEQLADVLCDAERGGPAAALPMYREAGVDEKATLCLVETGDLEALREESRKEDPASKPDWLALLGRLCAARGARRARPLLDALYALPPPPTPPDDPTDALEVASYNIELAHAPPPMPPLEAIVGTLLDHGGLPLATELATNSLELGSGEISGGLQTRLLAAHLAEDRAAGEKLLDADTFPEADPQATAQTCEELGLYARAIRLHPSADEVGRLICESAVDVSTAVEAIGRMGPPQGLAAVGRLVDTDTPEAAAKAVAAAIALHGTLGHSELASLFRPKEAGDNRERALLDYLRARVAAAGDDAALTFEYLGACCAAGQVDELERVTRDRSIAYDAVQACTLLREAGGAAGKDPRPLINVCDRHNLFGELATALLARRQLRHLMLYVRSVNRAASAPVCAALLEAGCEAARVAEVVAPLHAPSAPAVLGSMLDAECQADVVASLLEPLDGTHLAQDDSLAASLIEAAAGRNKLPLLKPWLDARKAEGLPPGAPNSEAIEGAIKQIKKWW